MNATTVEQIFFQVLQKALEWQCKADLVLNTGYKLSNLVFSLFNGFAVSKAVISRVIYHPPPIFSLFLSLFHTLTIDRLSSCFMMQIFWYTKTWIGWQSFAHQNYISSFYFILYWDPNSVFIYFLNWIKGFYIDSTLNQSAW